MDQRLFADSAVASGVRWLLIALVVAAVGDLVLDVPYYFGTVIPGLASLSRGRPTGSTPRCSASRYRRSSARSDLWASSGSNKAVAGHATGEGSGLGPPCLSRPRPPYSSSLPGSCWH